MHFWSFWAKDCHFGPISSHAQPKKQCKQGAKVTMMRNIEKFPSKQMYPYLSLVEKSSRKSSIIIKIEDADWFGLK